MSQMNAAQPAGSTSSADHELHSRQSPSPIRDAPRIIQGPSRISGAWMTKIHPNPLIWRSIVAWSWALQPPGINRYCGWICGEIRGVTPWIAGRALRTLDPLESAGYDVLDVADGAGAHVRPRPRRGLIMLGGYYKTLHGEIFPVRRGFETEEKKAQTAPRCYQAEFATPRANSYHLEFAQRGEGELFNRRSCGLDVPKHA